MKKALVLALAGLALVAGLWGAGGAAANENARVRVIHASPDAPNVDVYANGTRVLSNVPYKAASDYLSVPPGNYRFEVFPAGVTTNPVLTIVANLAAGTDYTVVALDRVSQLKYRVFTDNNAAPAAGKAHVNVIHAGSDAPAVDVGLRGGAALVQNLAFGQKQGPLPVDAGRYNLELRVAGTSQVALPLDGVQLEAGRVYTFVASGLLTGQPSLSVFPAVFSPAPATAPVTAPRAGEAGLAGESGASGWLPIAGIAALVALGGIAGVAGLRKVTARG